MVDYYREPYSTQALGLRQELEQEPEQHYTFPKVLEVEESQTVVEDDSTWNSEVHDGEERHDVEIMVNVLHDEDANHEAIHEAYSALPFPGVSYLSEVRRRLLFRRLSAVETKNRETMLRYLSIVEDTKAAGLPLTVAEWNSAISFAGRYLARVEATEVESALRTWKEMEQEAGVQSGSVTFNILFDIAAKAGKFVLAEMILKEMDVRNLGINRFARVGFIYYHGLKGDGQGVRLAYRDFVESGEIVDTVVMNCVIASLIRAGEPAAADQVYERMKQMLSRKTGATLPSSNWKGNRELGRVLDRATRLHQKDSRCLQQLRNEQYLGPNLHTYSIFIEHHASETGELRRISTLLDEMQTLGVPMHGRIFLKLFKGFANHGGIRYTSWTKPRLENVWSSLLAVLDQKLQEQDVRVMKWMVIWVIRAFEKCCGRERTLEIWEELKERWKPGAGEKDTVHHVLRDILKAQSGSEEREDP